MKQRSDGSSAHTGRLRTRIGLILCLVSSLTMLACNRAHGGRTIILGIDGLDPATIDLLMSEGKMPNFARMRQGGAYGRLVSAKPLLSPIIWTTVATGKGPSEHGIGHFVAFNEKTGERMPVTSQMRRVKALWNIFSDSGQRVGVVGWWATWPAEHVSGTVVSDHTCYHFLFEEGASGASDPTGLVYPKEKAAEYLSLVRRPADVSAEELRRFVHVEAEALGREFRFEDDLAHFRWALATAKSYSDIGLELWQAESPDLLMVYIEAVDSSSHLFGHLFRASGLAGELAEQQRHYGNTVEQMYLFADEIVGRYLAAMGTDTRLIVLSDHGFKLGTLHEDPSRASDMRRVSAAFHRLEGVLYLYGRGIRPGVRLEQPSIIDVAPTVLALAGLVPAADMPGRVLDRALIAAPPAERVASYETGAAGPNKGSQGSEAAPVDAAILEHLRSLGYLDTASPSGDRNMAGIHFEAGRYKEAAAEYRKLLQQDPEDGSLHASLAGALGASGDFEGALAELAEAERLIPLSPEIHHNRGVILERQGKAEQAVAEYRKALRYRPNYQPSRQALLRLTGSDRSGGPKTDAERLAAKLADRASDAARRGDYQAAMRKLDEAESVAPNYALVYQYRANVAFLMGDRERARAALNRALEIEPDNQLFRKNLDALGP